MTRVDQLSKKKVPCRWCTKSIKQKNLKGHEDKRCPKMPEGHRAEVKAAAAAAKKAKKSGGGSSQQTTYREPVRSSARVYDDSDYYRRW